MSTKAAMQAPESGWGRPGCLVSGIEGNLEPRTPRPLGLDNATPDALHFDRTSLRKEPSC